MLKRLGSALIFVAGSVVGGLALAFLIIALRPDLIRGPTRSRSGAAGGGPHAPGAGAHYLRGRRAARRAGRG